MSSTPDTGVRTTPGDEATGESVLVAVNEFSRRSSQATICRRKQQLPTDRERCERQF